MGQILGLGITHYPGLAYKGNLAGRSICCARTRRCPSSCDRPRTGPSMREQWADDEGDAHPGRHIVRR